MGQKSNPISLRLKRTNQHWSSSWYGDYNYTAQFIEECQIGLYIENIYQQARKTPPVVLLKRGREQVQIAIFLPQHQRPRIGVKNSNPFASARKNWLSKALNCQLAGARGGLKGAHQREGLYRGELLRFLLHLVFATKLAMSSKGQVQDFLLARNQPLIDTALHYMSDKFIRQRQPVLARNGGDQLFGLADNLYTPQLYSVPLQKRVDSLSHPKKGNVAATPTSLLKNYMEQTICTTLDSRCQLHFVKCPSIHQNPLFLAGQVVLSLQDRVPFRRLKDRLIRDISKNKAIKGVRITCSGRVAARSKKAQKAKKETIQWGQTSLHVFSELVHFASKSAQTTFGKVGVKVWICYSG